MISIRQMQKNDESQIVALMQKFYASSAVWSNGSEEIFRADVRECVGDSSYARGYVFECDGKMAGYGMLDRIWQKMRLDRRHLCERRIPGNEVGEPLFGSGATRVSSILASP